LRARAHSRAATAFATTGVAAGSPSAVTMAYWKSISSSAVVDGLSSGSALVIRILQCRCMIRNLRPVMWRADALRAQHAASTAGGTAATAMAEKPEHSLAIHQGPVSCVERARVRVVAVDRVDRIATHARRELRHDNKDHRSSKSTSMLNFFVSRALRVDRHATCTARNSATSRGHPMTNKPRHLMDSRAGRDDLAENSSTYMLIL
jgi:hypothetical protein